MIILLIILLIIIFILNIIMFGIIIVLERRNRIKRIKTNLGYFSPTKLSRRLEMYSLSIKKNNEIAEIREKFKDLELREFKKIKKIISQMELLTLPVNFFKFILFRNLYKKVIKKIKDYEKDYLDVRFTLFDLTSDIEVEKAILLQLKERFIKEKNAILNSPIEKIRENKKLNNKIKRLFTNFKKLEDMIDEQVKHLSDEFISFVIKVDSDIQNMASNLEFMNFHIKHIEEDLKIPLNQ
ncbi:MAG: hypothetical protein HRS50_00400, partial [Mycoplasmataceae bacterium]|nr:hypothetical protein [Mycoplasmataceae bacterium]